MKAIISFSIALLFLMGCGNNAQNQGNSTADTAEEQGPETYGETITADDAIAMNELAVAMEGKDSIELKLKGTVSSVCQVKGCWMELVGPEGSEVEPVFVKFKDYGFFMPKDLGGSQVVVRGKAFRSVTTVDELKHYAEDEGLPQEEIDAITEPKEELKFMADGVVVVERS